MLVRSLETELTTSHNRDIARDIGHLEALLDSIDVHSLVVPCTARCRQTIRNGRLVTYATTCSGSSIGENEFAECHVVHVLH